MSAQTGVFPRLLWLFWVLLLFSGRVLATSYVDMPDEALLAQSDLVVFAEVRSANPIKSEQPHTEYRLFVLERLHGALLSKDLVISVPGGEAADGSFLKIYGSPEFVPGERVLLFLSQDEQRGWQVVQMMLGAFHEAESAGGDLGWVRHLDGAVALGSHAPKPETGYTREYHGFKRWIKDVSAAQPADDNYWLEIPPHQFRSTLPGAESRFNLFPDPGRWIQFDNSSSVGWRAMATGQSGMAGGGFAQFQQALAAWTDDPVSNIRFEYLGTTANTTGLTAADAVNAIYWDDPQNEIAGSFSCQTGGVLARGGWRTIGFKHFYQSQVYWTVSEGDVITQDGAGCYFGTPSGTGANGAEVFAHEIGHTLGFWHSTDSGGCDTASVADQAIMCYMAHGDGRGADLGQDDEAAAAFLYAQPVVVSDCSTNTGTDTDVIVSRNYVTTGNFVTCIAVGSITTLAVTVASGAMVTYQSPLIVLAPGFQVASGGVFSARQP